MTTSPQDENTTARGETRRQTEATAIETIELITSQGLAIPQSLVIKVGNSTIDGRQEVAQF